MATKNNGTSRGFYSDYKSRAMKEDLKRSLLPKAEYNRPMAHLRRAARSAKKAREENAGVQVINHGKSVKM